MQVPFSCILCNCSCASITSTWIREPCFKMKRHTGNVCHICYRTLNFENAAHIGQWFFPWSHKLCVFRQFSPRYQKGNMSHPGRSVRYKQLSHHVDAGYSGSIPWRIPAILLYFPVWDSVLWWKTHCCIIFLVWSINPVHPHCATGFIFQIWLPHFHSITSG